MDMGLGTQRAYRRGSASRAAHMASAAANRAPMMRVQLRGREPKPWVPRMAMLR